jgi:molecular chaperone DnaK
MGRIVEIDLTTETAIPADDGRGRRLEARDRAKAAVFATEASLREHGEKILADDRAAIEAAMVELRAINDGDDPEAINARSVALIQAAAVLGDALHEARETSGPGPEDPAPGPAPKTRGGRTRR